MTPEPNANETLPTPPGDDTTAPQAAPEVASQEPAVVDAASAAPAEGTAATSAAPSEGADATSAAAPAEGADASDAGDDADDDSTEEAGDDADASEGGDDDAPAAGEAADATPGAPGEKKKRRRRRGKKRPADGVAADGTASPAGPAPASTSPTGDRKPKPAHKKPGGHPRERAAFHVGEETFGRVTSVTADAIMVDLSGKALGIFDRHELAADDLIPEVSDRFVAYVHGDGTRGGLVVLTRKPLREEEAKPMLEAAAASGVVVHALVTGIVKGGVEVDVGGLRAFAPASGMDLRLGADLAHYIGQRLDFVVAQYEKRGRDVVLTRKPMLETEAREVRKSAVSKLEIGAIVKGIVRTVLPYGAFIALPGTDGLEGLVHMTEASHDRGARLSDVLKAGEEVDVKILRVDERGKIFLSRKAATADPWGEVRDKYAEGTRHKGKVARIQPFGVFVELEPAVDGLVHTSDLTLRRIEDPSEVVKVGDEIDVIVAGVDPGQHRIRLHPALPEGEEVDPKLRVAPHKIVKVAVVTPESAGLVVRVLGITGRNARGFIPAGLTGTERGTDLRKAFPVGAQLEAKVIEIDPRRGEAKLSLRAVKEDREKAAYNEYRQSVAKASKFGTLGDLLAAKGKL